MIKQFSLHCSNGFCEFDSHTTTKIYKIMKQKKGITQSHSQEILDFSVNKISLCSDINTKLVWLVNDITN